MYRDVYDNCDVDFLEVLFSYTKSAIEINWVDLHKTQWTNDRCPFERILSVFMTQYLTLNGQSNFPTMFIWTIGCVKNCIVIIISDYT